jgi:large subunit ribosomal protein L24
MNTLHVKKGDTVMVISGVSKGSKGKVLETSPSDNQVIVEGVHMVSKHVKPRSAQQQGGIIKTEGPLRACKVMLVCPKCDKPTRVGHKFLENGKKVRVCKHCKETF